MGHSRAGEDYHRSLSILERIGDQHTSAIIYDNLGILYHSQSDRIQARAHYEKANALYEMVGDTQGTQKTAQELQEL